MKTAFIHDYSRDFSLILLELWYYGETHGMLNYLGNSYYKDGMIHYIFENNNGLTSTYIDENAYERAENFVMKIYSKDKTWIQKICKKYDDQVIELKKVWEKEILFSKKELLDFIELSKNAFSGLAITYFIALIKKLPEHEREYGLKSRAESDIFADKVDGVIRNTIKKLYPGLSGYEKYILIDELKSEQFPSKTELEARKKHFIYTLHKLYSNKNLDDLEKEHNIIIKREKILKTDTIKGQIAYKGFVKGKVRVILLKENIKDLKDGEVLVTSMTTPDFINSMKKAVAFVTDEGGIMCHAAIIAREFKKPCIIGTKIGTKILKDGDMVEVDAENGIVKIL